MTFAAMVIIPSAQAPCQGALIEAQALPFWCLAPPPGLPQLTLSVRVVELESVPGVGPEVAE